MKKFYISLSVHLFIIHRNQRFEPERKQKIRQKLLLLREQKRVLKQNILF